MDNKNDKATESQPCLKKYTIEELFEGYTGDYKPEELDWGKPVGKEE